MITKEEILHEILNESGDYFDVKDRQMIYRAMEKYALQESEKCKKIANIQYKKFCDRVEDYQRDISNFQNSYIDAVFKIQEMRKLLNECLEYVPQPSLIEDIAKIINED